jgi:hypothetical protein
VTPDHPVQAVPIAPQVRKLVIDVCWAATALVVSALVVSLMYARSLSVAICGVLLLLRGPFDRAVGLGVSALLLVPFVLLVVAWARTKDRGWLIVASVYWVATAWFIGIGIWV